jgi:metal-dependent amidase/aminoacylase/carboxypeptidase family protein
MPEDQLPVITMKGGAGPLVNDHALAERLALTLKSTIGDANVITESPPATGSEDIHELPGANTEVPLTYLLVGVADPAVFAAARNRTFGDGFTPPDRSAPPRPPERPSSSSA